MTDDKFPHLEIEDAGYNIAKHGQKTYNGVAILSKFPLDDVTCGLPDFEDEQARYIEAVVSLENEAIRVASVYVPNGNEVGSEKFAYKMSFFDALHKHAANLLKYEEKLAIVGDYNVAPTTSEIDVYAPKQLEGTVCCHPDEQRHFHRLQNLGLTDAYRILHPETADYTWWDYRGGGWQAGKGLRIDHILLSPEAADCLKSCEVISSERAKEKPSDHAPVIAEI